jgi:cytochrome c peroxidase
MTALDRNTVNRMFAHLGKAIAAYERLILPGPAPFDRYVQARLQGDQAAMEQALTPPQEAGMRLFIGKAQCVRCHNGPLFTNNEFHNTGVPPAQGLRPDHGRRPGIQQAKADPFNCLGLYGRSEPGDCAELRFAKTGEQLEGAFKTPGLRNVATNGPYMHAGQFASLAEVLAHYNTPPPAPVGRSELEPLRLSRHELRQLEAFLGSLSGPLATHPQWLQPIR